MENLLDASSLNKEDIQDILKDASQIKASLLGREIKKLPTLRGRTVISAFYENSTRTRVSFETAGKWLSADVINMSVSTSSVAKGESLRDTAFTLGAIGADAIVIRYPVSGAAAQIARWLHTVCYRPAIINAGDGMHEHPTQALLDALTLQESLGELQGRHIVIVGDILHSRVARSNIAILTTLGAHVTVVAPGTLLPVGVNELPGVDISEELDPILPIADAIMMLRVQQERMDGVFFPSPREYSIRYGLTEDRRKVLRDDAVILHPGPVIRGLEIGFTVADSSQSYIFQQVENGVHIRMAVLYRCILGSKTAAEEASI